jgi:hypothetical protein
MPAGIDEYFGQRVASKENTCLLNPYATPPYIVTDNDRHQASKKVSLACKLSLTDQSIQCCTACGLQYHNSATKKLTLAIPSWDSWL